VKDSVGGCDVVAVWAINNNVRARGVGGKLFFHYLDVSLSSV